MTAEPGDRGAAEAAACGYLRASHADREHVIDVLKAAFVQGRLTKDELDSRVSQTLAARTYAELAGLTADLPAGLIAAQPAHMPARSRTRPPVGKVVAGIVLVVPPPVMVLATFLTSGAGSEGLMPACALLLIIYFMVWTVAGAQMFANWHDKRSRGQLPHGPAPGPGGPASSRLPSADRGGQLPPAGPGQWPAAEAAPIRRPRLRLPGRRALVSLSYVR